MRNILAIGAHPDDIELGCGGTLRKHVLAGDKVYSIIASFGEKSGDRTQRKTEAIAAAKKIGIRIVLFLGLPDTMLAYNGVTISLLDQHINKINPEIVYVHTVKDYHQDHANIAKSVLSSLRRKNITILFYETPSTTIEFKPTAYSDISGLLEDKRNALQEYVSQNDKEYFEKEAIIELAKLRGYTIGVKYAEAFEVVRLFKW